MAAQKRSFHPVKELLKSRPGTASAAPRPCSLTTSAATTTTITARRPHDAGRRRRPHLSPGHKFDFVPILEGVQGKGKSTFIEILGLHWYNELPVTSATARRIEAMQGSWILEIGEFSAMQRSEVNDLKAFVSRTHDKARLHGRRRARNSRASASSSARPTTASTCATRPAAGASGRSSASSTAKSTIPRLRREIMQIWAEALHIFTRAWKPSTTAPLSALPHRRGCRTALVMQESRRVETAEEMLAGKI